MNYHPLVKQLLTFRESSKEAVADSKVQSKDLLKKHLHLERPVESDLKEIIPQLAETERASLLLVCGNVGDGKSHILSKLQGDKKLSIYMDKFSIHNDATESFDPNKTCIETLEDILNPFNDELIDESKDNFIFNIIS